MVDQKAGGDVLHQDKDLFCLKDLVKSDVLEKSDDDNQAPRCHQAYV